MESQRRRDLARACALFALVAVAVFGAWRDALHAWFANDDFLWLDLADAQSVLRAFVGPWGHGPAYRPLARLSFWLDSLLFGDDARLWHAESLLLHALAATLLGVLLARLSRDRVFAVAAALLFALLPLSDEVAIWISGRIYCLGLVFALASLVLLDVHLLAPSRGRLAAHALALLAALLTHEPFVVTPALAALVVAIRWRGLPSRRAAVQALATDAVVTVAYLALRLWAVGAPGRFSPVKPMLLQRLGDDLLPVLRLLLTQVELPLWLIGAALAVAAVWSPRWLGVAALGGLVAAIGFAPFAPFANFGLRYLYLSGAGLAVALAAAVAGLARVPWLGKPAAAALLIALLHSEWRGVEAVARDWREAGALARRTLELVAAADDGVPGGLAVVWDVPLVHGRGMMFYTYFEIAMRRFQPGFSRVAIPGHFVGKREIKFGSVRALIGREEALRIARGQGQLGCPAATTSRRMRPFLRAIAECDTLFLDVDPDTGRILVLPPATARERLAARLAQPPDSPPRQGRGRHRGRGAGRDSFAETSPR